MEMCYDGTLVMPSNYVVMDEGEMTYVDGGWSGTVLKNNLIGLYNSSKNARVALLAGGLSLGAIGKLAYSTAKGVYLCYGATISTAALAVGGVIVGLIVAAGLLVAINYLGNNRVWY